MKKEIQKALDLKIELDGYRPLNSELEARIMQKFKLDWNYHSNNLEGNSLTYGETKALILHGITAQGKPLKDHFEITGHNEAIEWVLDIISGNQPMTENFIRQFHEILLKEPYEVDAITPDGQPTKKMIQVGKYKSTPNHVRTKTGEMFYFASVEETPAKMSDLIDWYRSKRSELNSIVLAAEFHYRFILIHPFDDGNGRVARLLMNFILMENNYPPVIIRTEDKENYFAALRQADAGSIEPFITYITKNLIRSLEIMIAGAKGEDISDTNDALKEFKLLQTEIVERARSNKRSRAKAIESLKGQVDTILYPIMTMLNEEFLPETEKMLGKLITSTTLFNSAETPNNIKKNSWESTNLDTTSILGNIKSGDYDSIHLTFIWHSIKELPEIVISVTVFVIVQLLETGVGLSFYHHDKKENIEFLKNYSSTIPDNKLAELKSALLGEIVPQVKKTLS
jgi:Fic family protein